ncbi:alpha/beta-hydrolase [Abortiporus biennis]|nr:alpha/beta-hydrolase [Abortiporus biennis]
MELQPTLFKNVSVSRGYNFHYYYSPAEAPKPTLLFCHGFPSSSRDWRGQVHYFQTRGYGIIVPDMLGYGGTDKPTDPAAYVGSGLAQDLVDILDAEGINKAIVIGHDWGTKAVSRLANWHPERFLAYAFFSAPYSPPDPTNDYTQLLAATKKLMGYETIGYWTFFCEDDAERVIFDHWDSFLCILFPDDPSDWKTLLAPTGALKKTLLSDYKSPPPPYLTAEDKAIITETFRKNGLASPLCWYKVMLSGDSARDDAKIPPSRYLPPVSSPLFFGTALKDAVSIPAPKSSAFKNHKVTMKEYDSDHWVILSFVDQTCQDLEQWIQKDVLGNTGDLESKL